VGREGAAREARTAPSPACRVEYDSLNGGPRGGAPPLPSLRHFFLFLALSKSALARTRRLDALGQCHEFDSSASPAYEQSIAVISYGSDDALESASGSSNLYLCDRRNVGPRAVDVRDSCVSRRLAAERRFAFLSQGANIIRLLPWLVYAARCKVKYALIVYIYLRTGEMPALEVGQAQVRAARGDD
jgi:hypothetical protein